uniref:Uncharacterized protein n=1 Tax=Sphaerodactylus townsendi TaxID=933632 RepID=A0ACB8G5G4_9SAUR
MDATVTSTCIYIEESPSHTFTPLLSKAQRTLMVRNSLRVPSGGPSFRKAPIISKSSQLCFPAFQLKLKYLRISDHERKPGILSEAEHLFQYCAAKNNIFCQNEGIKKNKT